MASRPTGPLTTVCRMEVAGLVVRLIPVHTQVFQHHNIMGMLFSFAEKRDMIISQRKKVIIVNL